MKVEYKEFGKLKYIVRYPKGYSEGDRCPILFYAHGAGSRGDYIEGLIRNPFFKRTEVYENFPFISIAPQCYAHSWFDIFEELTGLLRHIASESYADPEHIYVMGASMGGYATWQLCISAPEYIAAAVPICGGGVYAFADRIKNVPIWAHHGALDEIVFPDESEKMVNAVIATGGEAHLTVYPDIGHASWIPVYNNPEVFDWLLSKKNTNAKAIVDKYREGEIYG